MVVHIQNIVLGQVLHHLGLLKGLQLELLLDGALDFVLKRHGISGPLLRSLDSHHQVDVDGTDQEQHKRRARPENRCCVVLGENHRRGLE